MSCPNSVVLSSLPRSRVFCVSDIFPHCSSSVSGTRLAVDKLSKNTCCTVVRALRQYFAVLLIFPYGQFILYCYSYSTVVFFF